MFDTMQFVRRVDNADRPSHNPWRSRRTFQNLCAVGHIFLFLACRGSQSRNGAGLNDKKLVPIPCPFNVLREVVVFFYLDTDFRKMKDLFISQFWIILPILWYWPLFRH